MRLITLHKDQFSKIKTINNINNFDCNILLIIIILNLKNKNIFLTGNKIIFNWNIIKHKKTMKKRIKTTKIHNKIIKTLKIQWEQKY